MALTRSIMALVSLVLLGASIMFMFFVILGGITNTSPLNKTQFLTADTSSITGARPVSQWNYFRVCGAGNTDCGSTVPDLPFGYAWVGGGGGAPPRLIGTHGKSTTSFTYFYIWRFGWVFYLMGLFFAVFAFFASIFAITGRFGSFAGSSLSMIALFWFSLGASLMTAEFVKARNQFRSVGLSASLGRYAFGFTWAAWACLALSAILLCVGGAAKSSHRERRRDSQPSAVRDTPIAAAGTGGGGMFSFYRNQRERRAARADDSSFHRNESQRRVKDEYA